MRSMGDVGVSVGDHGPGKGVNSASPVAPPHRGISPGLVIQIFQKKSEIVVTADLDLERNAQPLNCACRPRLQISWS